MGAVSKILDLENPVFCGYLTYGSILVLKTLLMSPLTTRQRMKNRVWHSKEDLSFHDLPDENAIKIRNDDVERVRRAHRNDLENIPIYFIASLAYVLTDPNPTVALNLFRVYTACRCAHTFVYAVCVVPQPARAITFTVAYAITGYMAIKAILYFKSF